MDEHEISITSNYYETTTDPNNMDNMDSENYIRYNSDEYNNQGDTKIIK